MQNNNFDNKIALSHMKALTSEEDKRKLEADNDSRNHFQRDRDRIMYSKAFRRLAGKTQVFLAGHDDHLRTRLTHTLEVSQIARSISAKLGLDLDLTEAIALGHDIGHAPFGHMGERVLNFFSNGCENYKGFNNRYAKDRAQKPEPDCGENSEPDCAEEAEPDILPESLRGFKHNWQSVRIVKDLTKHKGKHGLELHNKTIYGLLNHTKTKYKTCEFNRDLTCRLRERGGGRQCSDPEFQLTFYQKHYNDFTDIQHYTIESSVVALADEIAQRHHDIEDGIRANLITDKQLIHKLTNSIKLNCKGLSYDITKGQNSKEDFITSLSTLVIRLYVNKVTAYLSKEFGNNQYENLNHLINSTGCKTKIKKIKMNSVVEGDRKLKELLKNRILSSHIAQVMDGKADFLIRRLFKAFISNPQQLPDNTIKSFFRALSKSEKPVDVFKKKNLDKISAGEYRSELNEIHTHSKPEHRAILLRTICDYIAGMTDRKAISEYQHLYGIHNDLL